MQAILRAIAAGLIGLAALVLAIVADTEKPIIEVDHGQQQEPAPPLPQPNRDETNAAAMERSKQSGRPLVVYLTAQSCAACKYVEKHFLDAMRKTGELGIVDYDRDRATYDHYDVYGLVPVVLVYNHMGGDRWQNVGRYIGSDQIEAWLRPSEAASLKDSGGSGMADEVSLLVLHDDSPDCKAMYPVLAKVRAAGYKVVYANINAPENKRHIARFKVKQTPYFVMYKGHEATEVVEGPFREDQIIHWFQKTQRGELSGYARSDSQSELQPEDRVFLRRVLSPGSCGMLGCQTHGGGVTLEYVDEWGNPVSKPPEAKVEHAADVASGPVRPWPDGQIIPGSNEVPAQAGTCPTGGCPSCGGRRR